MNPHAYLYWGGRYLSLPVSRLSEKSPFPCPCVPPFPELVHLLVIFLGLIWVFLFLNWNMVSVSSLCVLDAALVLGMQLLTPLIHQFTH